jgi:hypothetical protein
VGSIGRFTLSASVAAGVLAIGLKRIIAANHKIVSLNGIEELLSIEVNGCTQWISIRGRDRRNPVVLGKTCFWSRNGIGEAPARRSHRTIPQRSRRVGRCANCKLTPYPGPIGTLGVGASAPSVNGWFTTEALATGEPVSITTRTLDRWRRSGSLEAPRKRFVSFANSAHMAMLEEPGQYLDYLVRFVRPTAAF